MAASRSLQVVAWGLLVSLASASAGLGILHVVKDDDPQLTKDYCINYNINWTSLPQTLNNITYTKLVFLTPKLLCSRTDATPEMVKDKAIVVMRGNCTFVEKTEIAHYLGAKILLIASEIGLNPPYGNKSKEITLPVALIRNMDIIDLKQNLGKNVNVALYAPTLPSFDYSIVIIFLIAVLCVILGGYWSGMTELERLKLPPGSESQDSLNDEEILRLTPVTAVIFVASCCIMLVLMYYFYKYLVYVIISIFCIGSAGSLYCCLSVLIKKIPYGKCRFPCFNQAIEVRLFFLAVFCASLAIVWAVFRNDNRWAWILQDILGIAFCVNFIATIKLTNFKSCVILFSLLLVYDVFFVFITPYLTKSGESIMVEVAVGPVESSEKNDGNLVEASAERSAPHEKLPVVIKVPRLAFSVIKICFMPFSLLGYGDIVVPGLLVAYCYRFDVQTNLPAVYFISCTIAYAVGMLITFLALILMRMAQPALLYLVPCTLLTSALVAWYRKEMKSFWEGNSYKVMDPVDFAANEDNTRASEQGAQ